jgi:hypothetical protein
MRSSLNPLLFIGCATLVFREFTEAELAAARATEVKLECVKPLPDIFMGEEFREKEVLSIDATALTEHFTPSRQHFKYFPDKPKKPYSKIPPKSHGAKSAFKKC